MMFAVIFLRRFYERQKHWKVFWRNCFIMIIICASWDRSVPPIVTVDRMEDEVRVPARAETTSTSVLYVIFSENGDKAVGTWRWLLASWHGVWQRAGFKSRTGYRLPLIRVYVVFISLSGKCCISNLNCNSTFSFRILSNSLFISQPLIWHYVLTASLITHKQRNVTLL
jgi:hypothetical protein